jgi:hypothetical protein
MPKNPILRSILICDSIQRDVRGLPTVRGIYPHRIVGSTKPWARQFNVYLAFENPDNISTTVSIRVTTPNVRFLSDAVFDKGSAFFDFDMAFHILVAEEGLLEIEWKFSGGRWRKGPTLALEFAKDVEELDEKDTALLTQYHENRSSVSDLLDRIEFSFTRLRYGASMLGNI